jgi:hypothetical protein
MTRAKLKAAAAVLLVAATALWSYAFIYEPLVQGRWLFAVSLVAAALFWAGLRETARRKAESIDYRRQ